MAVITILTTDGRSFTFEKVTINIVDRLVEKFKDDIVSVLTLEMNNKNILFRKDNIVALSVETTKIENEVP